ncbi:MAG: hypothetical protein V4683_20050 [Bacteroidota bacterium]
MKTTLHFIVFFLFIQFKAISQIEKLNSKRILKKLEINQHNLNLFYFLEPTCPISQKYQSVISAINKEFTINDVNSTFIFPNKFSSPNSNIQFANEIDPKSSVILDQKKSITNQLGAKTTPEVFLINSKGEIEYKGAIDDWFYQLGKKRNEPTQHYLKNAIKNYLLKYPIIPKFTEAIGCDIE